jgi:glycosyltransferase involved in cell wall biosynthesis
MTTSASTNNILLIANKVPHYRVSVYNYLARRFGETGWRFDVASESRLRESEQKLGFEFYEQPFGFFRYCQLIDRLKPKVVILHLHLKIPMFWPLLHWLKWKGIPVVSWTKGGNLDQPGNHWRQALFNHTHRLSNALLLYSAAQSDLVPPRHRHKIFAANNTVNFEDYPEVPDVAEQIKEEFNIPFPKVVLFTGTMGVDGERKRVRHLIDIFRGLDRKDVGLVLVGGGMNDELKAAINPANTLVLGPVHDPRNLKISRLFKAADLFVVPGHVGLGINQAFYWGLPVITENCHQPPEIQYLQSGRNGFIVPDNDVAALRDKMLFLLDHDTVRAQFGRCAREDIMKQASIEGMFQSFARAVTFASADKADRCSPNCRRQSVTG